MSVQLLVGDCRETLRSLRAESAQVCVTSPPYYGLRDYGTASWEGGDESCDHKHGGQVVQTKHKAAAESFATGMRPGVDSSSCRKCGAIRVDQQLGLEKTPAEYVEKMVAVFREVKRVLRDDGTLWLNIGDTYNAQPGQRKATDKPGAKQATSVGSIGAPSRSVEGCKPKDLIGIPWMLAFALRADGWYLRSDIIWAKSNPMPESVTDRPTKSHEYLFLLSKSATYFYDAEAIKEAASESAAAQWYRTNTVYLYRPRGTVSVGGSNDGLDTADAAWRESGTRNARSVWTIATQPYSGAHFATFPPKLIEPCIKAGSSDKSCEHCGTPWNRQTVVRADARDARNGAATKAAQVGSSGAARVLDANGWNLPSKSRETVGFAPSCECGSVAPVPSTVLDPFAGAGTTGLVSDRLGRNAILCELNEKYADMARDRLRNDSPLFMVQA